MSTETRNKRECYVAMLDIMGFKSIVKRRKPENVYKLFEKVYIEAERQRSFKTLDIIIFSDTIIIITDDNTMHSYEDIVISSSNFANLFIKDGYAINGAITYGEVTYDKDKNICFGIPLTDAHILQEDLFFYGIVLHESANKQRRTYASCPFLHHQCVDMVINLKVPTKSKGLKEFYCVNWCEGFYSHNACFEDQIKPVKKCIRNIYNKNQKSERGMLYIINTEMVLKQWFDFTARTNHSIGWGDPIYEEVEMRCPEMNYKGIRCDLEYSK